MTSSCSRPSSCPPLRSGSIRMDRRGIVPAVVTGPPVVPVGSAAGIHRLPTVRFQWVGDPNRSCLHRRETLYNTAQSASQKTGIVQHSMDCQMSDRRTAFVARRPVTVSATVWCLNRPCYTRRSRIPWWCHWTSTPPGHNGWGHQATGARPCPEPPEIEPWKSRSSRDRNGGAGYVPHSDHERLSCREQYQTEP